MSRAIPLLPLYAIMVWTGKLLFTVNDTDRIYLFSPSSHHHDIGHISHNIHQITMLKH